ncbi:hypothetical protein HMI54_009652, partial [Coelomomyces lativittatus]
MPVGDALGRRLVSALILEGNIKILEEKGLTDKDVFDDARQGLVWILDYYREKEIWPTIPMVNETVGGEFPIDPGHLDHVAENIRKRSLANKLENTFRRAAETIESRDPDAALKILRDTV